MLVELILHRLPAKLWALNSLINCLFFVPTVLNILKFCWTVSSVDYIFSQGLKMLGLI
jgi:hypothetical protein